MSQLPDDIGRRIFELAAEDGSGPSCALVSKEVQSWVEPVMYRRIVARNENTVVLFCRTLQEASSSKRTLLASHIEVLIVASPITGPIGAIVAMLKSLRNVRTLMLWDWHVSLYEVVTSSHLAPTRLSLSRLRLLPAQRNFTHSMFKNITHLELVWRYQECWDRWNWDSLLQLTHLTHLALNFISNFLHNASPAYLLGLVEDTLSKCAPSLRVCLLWIPMEAFSFESYRDGRAFQQVCDSDVDGRVVVGCFTTSNTGKAPASAMINRAVVEIIDDWAGVSSRKDFWTLAEGVIEKRRRPLLSSGNYN